MADDLFFMDLKGVDPIEFDLLPEGTYSAQIEQAEKTESSQKKVPQLKLTFRITYDGFVGRKIWYFIGLSDPSRAFFMRDVIALGMYTKEELDSNKVAFKLSDFVGREVGVVVKHTVSDKKDDAGKNLVYSNVAALISLDKVRGPKSTPVAVATSAGGSTKAAKDSDDVLPDLFDE